jgi:hypothetical protein
VREKIIWFTVYTIVGKDGRCVGVRAHHIKCNFGLGEKIWPVVDGEGRVGAG